MYIDKPKVLIADYKNSDAVSRIPYVFKKAGCAVEVFCDYNSWLLKTSHTDLRHVVSRMPAEQYAAQLQELITSQRYGLVVLGDDHVIRLMNDAIPDTTIAGQLLPLSKLEHRSLLGSKAGLSEWCTRYNILTPPYAVYDGKVDLSSVLNSLTFPVLVKIDHSDGGRGVFLCNDLSAIEKTLATISLTQKNGLIFQEYIAGDNIAVEAVYKQGQLLGYTTAKVLQTISNEFSLSMVRQYEYHADIDRTLRHIGETLGFNGFCSMTFMCSKISGEYYLIEADLRPNAWFALASAVALDFSRVWREYFSSTSSFIRTSYSSEESKNIIHHATRDFTRLVEKRNFMGMVRWVFHYQRWWQFIPWDDKKLVWYSVVQVVKGQLYSITVLRAPLCIIKRWHRRITSGLPVR